VNSVKFNNKITTLAVYFLCGYSMKEVDALPIILRDIGNILQSLFSAFLHI